MAHNYLTYTIRVHDHLKEMERLLSAFLPQKQIRIWTEELDYLSGKLETMHFQVSVVGEFKRGKTSFINALLRKRILPANVRPTTATMNRITYGIRPTSYLRWKDGRPVQKIEVDQLSSYITKLTDASSANAQKIEEAVVEYPCRFCENNVDLIDTPGMNDNDDMNNVTISGLSGIDLAIVTLEPSSPVSLTEARFIARLVENEQICQIVYVISKMDTIEQDEREDLLQAVGHRLVHYVEEMLLETHTAGDPVMEKFKSLFASPIIFPVSSQKALYAYEMGSMDMLEESGFRRLNDELLPLIIRSQHREAILTPLRMVMRVAQEFRDRLETWHAQAENTQKMSAVKTAFGNLAYSYEVDYFAVRQEALQRMKSQERDLVKNVSGSLLQSVMSSTVQANVIASVRDTFQQLNACFRQDESLFYQRMWEENIRPVYLRLEGELMELLRPYPQLIQELDSFFRDLVESDLPETLFPEAEAFFWEQSPIPAADIPRGQIPYVIDTSVRVSIGGYYRRREMRLSTFLERIRTERIGRIEALVQALFRFAANSLSEGAPVPKVERQVLQRLSERLEALVRGCQKTQSDYIQQFPD